MNVVFEDYLFSRGYLVGTEPYNGDRHSAAALVGLANFANIKITSHPELADQHMVDVAARNLGKSVPPAFYAGFPNSVRTFTKEQLAFDQFVHYTITYGFGDFSTPGHSLFEEHYERAAFNESTEYKPIAIILPDEALELIKQAVDASLASTRPLKDMDYQVLLQYVKDHGYPAVSCACKDTVCRLIIDTRAVKYADSLILSDVIRLVEWLLEYRYPEMPINKLNLKNQDRKLLSSVLDYLFALGKANVAACLEKRRQWVGLLHHIHYKPRNEAAKSFCETIRRGEERSAYSAFEAHMSSGNIREALDGLKKDKGVGAVARNTIYLLSRCKDEQDVAYVLENMGTPNKILLIQLLINLRLHMGREPRSFVFTHLSKMRRHDESEEETAARRTYLSDDVAARAREHVEALLADACKGKLGRVYISQEMGKIALPLNESASMGGFGTLPSGSRLPIPEGKKIRAFIYWERVNDIDLSCFGLDDTGRAQEFSWRTMRNEQSDAITYSGDQTSGYHGGSEYFDIDFEAFKEMYPTAHYVVLCANVYTYGVPFSNCTCKAGYMTRDREDSGEIFEPKTVKSSFAINCKCSGAYLYALDLHTHEVVWLNLAEKGDYQVAGTRSIGFLRDRLRVIEAMNLGEFARLLATEVVSDSASADIVFSDEELSLPEGVEQIRSYDTPRVVELLNS